MESNGHELYKHRINLSKLSRTKKGRIYFLISLAVICTVWHFAAIAIDRSLVLPSFTETMRTFFTNWVDTAVMSNLAITLRRVLTGFLYAVIIGLPLGLLMGFFETFKVAFAPIMNSVRQVPIMAWIPLSIIWFGLGDGPTIFLITMASIFPLMLNTMAGVSGIDPNYIHAAKSMGAGTGRIFLNIILPGSLPSFLVGCRLALGLGWMSVICAEFIATSEGFGFLLVESQIRMQTPRLYSLMIMAAIVGYLLDRILLMVERSLTSWRFKDGAFKG